MYSLSIPVLFLLFTFTALQDFKDRKIHILLPAGILVSGLIQALFVLPASMLGIDIIINAAILCFQYASLWLYIKLKGRNEKLTDSYFGWGDILFLLALTPFFSPFNFVAFNISGFLVIALSYWGASFINKNSNKQIPLAGAMSIYMLLFMLLSQMCGLDDIVHNDNVLIQILENL